MALLSYEQVEEILDWIESDKGTAVIAAADERERLAREGKSTPVLANEMDQEPKTSG